jgi:hypothetical protein
VTDGTETQRPSRADRLVRDILSVLFITAGTLGVVAAAWTTDPVLGFAAVCAAITAVGVLLGLER